MLSADTLTKAPTPILVNQARIIREASDRYLAAPGSMSRACGENLSELAGALEQELGRRLITIREAEEVFSEAKALKAEAEQREG